MQLLTISKGLETLEHPFQSCGAFCPMHVSKLKEMRTEMAYKKGKFFGALKWLLLIPGGSSATERYPNFLLSYFLLSYFLLSAETQNM